MSAAVRLQQIEEFLAKHAKGFRAVGIDNVYKGPYKDRKITNVSYAEFISPDLRREALNCIGAKTLTVEGHTISIKNARSKVNGQRNYALRQASELLKSAVPNKTMDIKWDDRTVTFDGNVAFSQAKADVSGSFLPPFAELVPP